MYHSSVLSDVEWLWDALMSAGVLSDQPFMVSDVRRSFDKEAIYRTGQSRRVADAFFVGVPHKHLLNFLVANGSGVKIPKILSEECFKHDPTQKGLVVKFPQEIPPKNFSCTYFIDIASSVEDVRSEVVRFKSMGVDIQMILTVAIPAKLVGSDFGAKLIGATAI